MIFRYKRRRQWSGTSMETETDSNQEDVSDSVFFTIGRVTPYAPPLCAVISQVSSGVASSRYLFSSRQADACVRVFKNQFDNSSGQFLLFRGGQVSLFRPLEFH